MVLIKIWSLKCKPETPWPFTLFKSPIPYFNLRFIIISRHIKTSYNYKFMECVSDSPLHFLTNNIAIIYKKKKIYFLIPLNDKIKITSYFFQKKMFPSYHILGYYNTPISLPDLWCNTTVRPVPGPDSYSSFPGQPSLFWRCGCGDWNLSSADKFGCCE